MRKALAMVLVFGLLFAFGCNKANIPNADENSNRENIQAENSSSVNNPFFNPNVEQLNYKGKFIFDDIVEKDVKLNINEVAKLEDGIVYELRIDGIMEVPEERLSLGYFYVQKDKIYKIEPTEGNLRKIKDNGQLPEDSVIVCQDGEINDELGEERGLHRYLEVKGDVRKYHSYNDLVESGYFETIIWEKEKGMISYRSGFGAGRDLVELDLGKYNKQESEEQSNINISENSENFYGVWEFIEPVTVHGFTPEESLKYLSKQFIYMPLFCRCGPKGLNNPKYLIEKLGRESFGDDLRQYLDKNNIDVDFANKIVIFRDDEKQEKWEAFGGEFYIVGDKIIVVIDGKLYGMKKVFEGEVENYLVDEDTVHVGQKIGSLTVKSIEKNSEMIGDITFSGEITVKGVYEWDYTGDGYGCVITLDEESRKIIPVFENFADEKTILINNTEIAHKLLPKESGEAEIVIDNYSIGYRQIMTSADLVRVVSLKNAKE